MSRPEGLTPGRIVPRVLMGVGLLLAAEGVAADAQTSPTPGLTDTIAGIDSAAFCEPNGAGEPNGYLRVSLAFGPTAPESATLNIDLEADNDTDRTVVLGAGNPTFTTVTAVEAERIKVTAQGLSGEINADLEPCNPEPEPTTTTTTTAPSTTTTTEAPTTTTTQPETPPTTATTTTTTAAPETSVTTAAPQNTSGGQQSQSGTSNAGGQPANPNNVPEPVDELPRTGMNGWLAAIGAGSIALGVVLTRKSNKRPA